MILQNEIKCNECGDQIYSQYRHDFKHCKCGAVAVDGGQEYLRRLGSDYTELSVVVADEFVKDLEGIIMDTENLWTPLGKVCAIARYMRDKMGINIGEAENVD